MKKVVGMDMSDLHCQLYSLWMHRLW